MTKTKKIMKFAKETNFELKNEKNGFELHPIIGVITKNQIKKAKEFAEKEGYIFNLTTAYDFKTWIIELFIK